ncbi:hypothetical protein E2C01_053329 [Portunus trituberculatus]|uniref:Uncharacterized protein n=1 Tax=Portunus trituberculatus TaxID=210409 RepID=A0A5B7GK08_PORTR|nr:hypothetical protein [Portunus trituberculatus]
MTNLPVGHHKTTTIIFLPSSEHIFLILFVLVRSNRKLDFQATRLLTGEGIGPLEFTEPRYCALMQEDAALGAPVVTVLAVHRRDSHSLTSTSGNCIPRILRGDAVSQHRRTGVTSAALQTQES